MYKFTALFGIVITVFLLYLPAVNGPYLLDDYANLVQNEDLILEQINLESVGKAAMSSPSSFLGRPLSMLSFAFNYTLAGDKDPFPVKLTNILLHLITGIGIFILLKLLLAHWVVPNNDNIFWTALFTTTIWLIHPLQISTVLYAVQRMTILSALFTVLGLIAYMKYRQSTILTNSHFLTLLLSVSGFTILGVLSKENAILLPLFALLIEGTVFRFAFHPQTSSFNKTLVKSILYCPLLVISAYLVYSYFNARSGIIWPHTFDIDQRLLTQPRMLMHYLSWILLINPEPMSLHHTNIGLSTGLLTPVTTLPAILTLILLAGGAWYSLKHQRYPIFGFGILWLLIGHLLESTTVPLELIFEHRNYLPMVGILLIPAYFIVQTLGESNQRVFFCTAILLLTGLLGYERISIWGDEKTMILESLDKQADVSWSWSDTASYLSRAGNVAEALGAMRTAARLDPLEPAFIFGEAYIRCQHMPANEFPEDFKSVLVSALENKPLTTTSVNSFANMIKICLTTRANDTTLRQLYLAAANNPMGNIADIGRLALDKLDNRK